MCSVLLAYFKLIVIRVILLAFNEHLLCAGHCANYCIWMISLTLWDKEVKTTGWLWSLTDEL